jgi:hypothetical protein
MKLRPFNVGLEGVSQWRRADEAHLPTEGQLTPEFSAETTPLEAILRPPRLDERLPMMTVPDQLDPALLEPAIFATAKKELGAYLRECRLTTNAQDAPLVEAAILALATDSEFDTQVRHALVALFRG